MNFIIIVCICIIFILCLIRFYEIWEILFQICCIVNHNHNHNIHNNTIVPENPIHVLEQETKEETNESEFNNIYSFSIV